MLVWDTATFDSLIGYLPSVSHVSLISEQKEHLYEPDEISNNVQ